MLFLFSLLTTYFFIILIPGIVTFLVWWILYEKAGYEGWKSIIPIYNLYINTEIAYSGRNTLLYFILLFIPYINILATLMLNWNFVSRYTDDSWLKILYMIFPFIGGIILAFSDKYQYVPDYDKY